MANGYLQALKGTYEAAAATIAKIQQNLLECKKNGKSTNLHCVSVLNEIGQAIVTNNGVHYDVYCDIFERILTPTMVPETNELHWHKYLEFTRYFHYMVAEKEFYVVASRVFKAIAAKRKKLQGKADYKLVMSIYCNHLMLQRTQLARDPKAAKEQIEYAVSALVELFEEMLQRHNETNCLYPQLVADFIQFYTRKRSKSALSYLMTLPVQKKRMYESFFAVVQAVGTHTTDQTMSVEEFETQCQYHLEAFVIFVQLDADEHNPQLALQHLRVCRELQLLQKDKVAGYVFSLLYYLLKFVYAQSKINNFARTYAELCSKITNFFEKSGEILMETQWFKDFMIALSQLFVQMHASTTKKPFDVFWQQMEGVSCYAAHFQLIVACIKLSPLIAESKLSTISCCSSVRKHNILLLAQLAFASYSTFVCKEQEQAQTEPTENTLAELNKNFTLIVRHAINVVVSMNCITPTSMDLRMLYARFGQLTHDIKTSAQARFCLTLGEMFVKIQSKFSALDWTLVVRRLYKTAMLTGDQYLISDLQSCYIVALLQETPQPDLTKLRNQINIYYNAANEEVSCLLAVQERSVSIFKSSLTCAQKRLLHWLEKQIVFRYIRNNIAALKSLLECSQTNYEFVLVARSEKLHLEASSRLQIMRRRLGSAAKVKRLEQLELAHACTILLRVESATKTITLQSKDCTEDSLENLLQRKELMSLNVKTELVMIGLGAEALQAFEVFFEKADTAHISSDDAVIDWEAILEDLAYLANYMHFSGYMDYATQSWILHYRIANTIDDWISAFRGLAYFFENAEYFENDERLNLTQEIAKKEDQLLSGLEQLTTLSTREQTYVLLCVCQYALYHAQAGNLSYAELMLWSAQNHQEKIHERQGKYDLVLATVEAVRFRILWKHLQNKQANAAAVNQLLQQCLLRDIDIVLEHFRDFVYISSTDTMPYLILLLSLTQQISECIANRLCDNIVSAYLTSSLRAVAQAGAALRVVQLLTMWMWINLQMEHLPKAQVKLKFIECLMGVKCPQDFTQYKTPETLAVAPIEKRPLNAAAEIVHEMLTLQLPPSMEAMRKQAQLHVSPVKTDKYGLGLTTTMHERDLKRYLTCEDNPTLQQNELLQWNYFAVGCLKARLHFLSDNFEQLAEFYEQTQKWLQAHKTSALQLRFQNFELLSMQHHANYLRAQKKHNKALQCLQDAVGHCIAVERSVDNVYRINFLLQLNATKSEMKLKQTAKLKRRILYYDGSSPDDENMKLAKDKVRDKMMQEAAKGKSKRKTVKVHNELTLTPSLKIVQDFAKSLTTISSSGSTTPEIVVKRKLPSSSSKKRQQKLKEIDDLNTAIIIDLSDTTEESVHKSALANLKRSCTPKQHKEKAKTLKLDGQPKKSTPKQTSAKTSVKKVTKQKTAATMMPKDTLETPPASTKTQCKPKKKPETKDALVQTEVQPLAKASKHKVVLLSNKKSNSMDLFATTTDAEATPPSTIVQTQVQALTKTSKHKVASSVVLSSNKSNSMDLFATTTDVEATPPSTTRVVNKKNAATTNTAATIKTPKGRSTRVRKNFKDLTENMPPAMVAATKTDAKTTSTTAATRRRKKS